MFYVQVGCKLLDKTAFKLGVVFRDDRTGNSNAVNNVLREEIPYIFVFNIGVCFASTYLVK